MRKLILGIVLFCYSVLALAANNFIQMSYATMSIYQNIVLSSAQKSGGTFTLSIQAKDGGGRGPPNYSADIINLRIDYYNSSGTLLGYSLSNNSTNYYATTYSTYTLTSANCGSAGSCANVAYMKVSFTGNDGGYWAGNVGTRMEAPTLTYTPAGGTASGNILYNPQWAVYTGYTASSGPTGWYNTTTTWGGNTHPQLYDAGATLSATDYYATGGTTSGQAGGYTAGPTYVSSITSGQQTTYNNSQTLVSSRSSGNAVYIDQVGSYNNVTVTQYGTKNVVQGVGQQSAAIQGDYNNITVRQGDPAGSTARANVVEMAVYGSGNTVNLNQGIDNNGNYTGQDVGGHYQYQYINGNNNSVTASQQNSTTSTTGNFISNTVNGNSNIQNFTQSGATAHQIFSTVTGDSNTMSVTQSGNGGHYLSVTEYGNGNDAQVTQSGNTKNNATINLTNNGGAASVTLQQSGGQTYNIDRTCTTTCGRVIVTQP